MKSEGVVEIAKCEERGIICPPHMGFGIGTNPKECYIGRYVDAGLS